MRSRRRPRARGDPQGRAGEARVAPSDAAGCGRSAAPATPQPGPGRGRGHRRGPRSPRGKRAGAEDGSPGPAADLGQSPPRVGLSFHTRRPGLTVLIAALAPFGRSFRVLGGSPSRARSPFLGPPGPRGRPQTPITAAARWSAPGWPAGWTGRGPSPRAGGRPLGDLPRGRSAPPGWAGAGRGARGGLTWPRTRPAGTFQSAWRRHQSGRRVGRRPRRDAHSSLRCRGPRPRTGSPSGVPTVFWKEAAGSTARAKAKPAYPERTTRRGPPWRRRPAAAHRASCGRPEPWSPRPGASPGSAPAATPKGPGRSCAAETYPVGAVSSVLCARGGPPLVLPGLAGAAVRAGAIAEPRSGLGARRSLASSRAAQLHVTCELRSQGHPQSYLGLNRTAKGANCWAEAETQAQGEGSGKEVGMESQLFSAGGICFCQS